MSLSGNRVLDIAFLCFRVLDIAFLCFRVLDITILCHSLATESWILPSSASESWTLQFYVTLWLQSPGYCLPLLRIPGHYSFMSLSGYRILDIAFLCFRVLDITILCHSLATESWILPSSASESWILPSCVSESWILQFYVTLRRQSPGYCLPLLHSPGHYIFIPISGYLAMDGYLQLHFQPCFLCTVSRPVLTTVRMQAKVSS